MQSNRLTSASTRAHRLASWRGLDVSGHVGRLRGGIARLPHAVGGDAAVARNPGVKLGCDVNAVVSCSTVAESWQAEFIKFAGLSFPNAFFGIAAESVFVTIAVIGLSKVVVPRWFALCTWLGGLAPWRTPTGCSPNRCS